MQVVHSVKTMQRLAGGWRRESKTVAFVPTMGCLHEGHLSLMRHARKLAGPKGIVAVSIFVNPTQFGPKEDFTRYPRDLPRDLGLCRQTGVDVVFAPESDELYPGPEHAGYSTYVVEERLSKRMEGASRPTHFRGVTTVVAKLFNIVLPDVAVFGAKDFQQAAIIQRMVKDLNFPVRIVVAPTVRERDGLAMSSRNRYLTPAQRLQALSLRKALQEARRAVKAAPRRFPAAALRKRLSRQIERHPEARVDYLEFFDPQTLEPVAQVLPGTQMALAVFVGGTRLIDNARL